MSKEEAFLQDPNYFAEVDEQSRCQLFCSPYLHLAVCPLKLMKKRLDIQDQEHQRQKRQVKAQGFRISSFLRVSYSQDDPIIKNSRSHAIDFCYHLKQLFILNNSFLHH